MPSHSDKNIIGNLRGRFDPHYKLASNVEGIEKGLGIEVAQIHKTLSKSFAMQRKTLVRVLGLEKRVNVLELEQAAEEQAKEGIDEILNDLGEEAQEGDVIIPEVLQGDAEVGGDDTGSSSKVGVLDGKKKPPFKINRRKIKVEDLKKGTSVESLENIQDEQAKRGTDKSQNPDISGIFREPRPDIDPEVITPEVLPPEEEPKKTTSVGEGLKNILESIAGTTQSIKEILIGQQQAEKDAAADAFKENEDAKKKKQEKKVETKMFDGIKKVGEKILAPVQSIWERVWNFIKTILLASVVGKLMDWFSDPKNKEKIGSIFRFVKDWWPALLTGFLLFGTGIGSLITGTVAAIGGFIPVLVGMLPKLLAFLASPIGLAVLGTAAVVGGGVWLHNKMKGDDNKDNKDKKIEDKTQKLNKGGIVKNFNTVNNFNEGGSVPGQGNTDTVPAMLTPGEFVLTKEATEKYGTDTLEGMNAAAATGKKETSGTGRLIGSTIGGLAGGVVGFFADSPVSPVADIALGMAGSAAGGEIGDNIERKLTGKGDSATNATQSFRNGGLVQYLNNGGRVGYGMGMVMPDQYVYNLTEFKHKTVTKGGEVIENEKTLTDIGGAIGVQDLQEHQTQLVESLRQVPGYEKINFMDVIQYPDGKGRLASMPAKTLYPILNASDAAKATKAKKRAAHEKFLVDNNLIKPNGGVKGYSYMDGKITVDGETRDAVLQDGAIRKFNKGGLVTNNNVANPIQSFRNGGLVQYLNNGGMVKDTSWGWNANTRYGRVVSGNVSQEEYDNTKRLNKLEEKIEDMEFYAETPAEKKELIELKTEAAKLGSMFYSEYLPGSEHHDLVIQEKKDIGMSDSKNATLKGGQVVSGDMNQSNAEKTQRKVELEKYLRIKRNIYGRNSPEANEIQKQIMILSGIPEEAIYTDKKGNLKTKGWKTYDGKTTISGEKRSLIPKKSQKNPANFLQPQGFDGKDDKKPQGLGRMLAGAADMLTGGWFDFDKRGNDMMQTIHQAPIRGLGKMLGIGHGGKRPEGMMRNMGGVVDHMTMGLTDFDKRGKGFGDKPEGVMRMAAGLADAMTGNLTDFDKKGGKTFGASRVLAGAADALTGDKWDFDKHSKKTELKPIQIEPPATFMKGGKGGNITTLNSASSEAPINLSGGGDPAPEVPSFSATVMRSVDKIKTLGIMV